MSIVVLPDGLRTALRRLLPVALALALVAGAAVAVRPGPATAPAAARAATAQVLLLSGSSLSYADAQRTTAALQWQASVYSLPGAGLSRSTLDPAGSITGTARRLLPAPGSPHDVVVIQGGEADHASPPATVQVATEHLVDYVRAHAPQARLVLVGPIPGESVPRSLTVVNDVLAAVAEQRGVPYVDALAAGWQAGDPAVPSALADRLGEALSG